MRFWWQSLATVYDWLVAPSFGAPGYRARQRLWPDGDSPLDLHGRVFVVTGANAGIGRATTLELAKAGATVHMVCRNRSRGEIALTEISEEAVNGRLVLHIADISEMSALRELSAALASSETELHGLVHNAGALLHDRQITSDGLELTFAAHVAGPFLLTHLLLPQLRAGAPARVVFVSSGGMYAQKLRLEQLASGPDPFDGVLAYAQAKRAQVILAREWAIRLRDSGIEFSSMHPGWVDTGGVRTSLPRFYKLTRWFLRTPQQGADTVVWLAASPDAAETSGGFYFDRLPRREHLPLRQTRSSDVEIEALWQLCADKTGLSGESQSNLGTEETG